MTPEEAILKECKYCLNNKRASGCNSDECKLNDVSKKPLDRIKAHCKTCMPEEDPSKCKGRVLTPEKHICPLHPFRTGKPPRKRRRRSKRSQTKTRNS